MAVALQNPSLYLLCVRCKKIGQFVCERCSDRYCSKACQVLDWPFHRQICIQMPSLLEVPSEGPMIPMCDQRLALTYHTNSPNQYQPELRNNNDRKRDNFPRVFGGQSFIKPNRKELCDARYFQPKMDAVYEAQPNLPIEAAHSNDADEIVNLAAMKLDREVPLIKRERQMSQKPLNWNEDNPDHIHALEQLTSNDSRNWQKQFPLENDSFVVVVHFDGSPTVNCWVVQNQHKARRQQLMDEMKELHENEGTELHKVITNEVYSISYKDNYYRGVCLYQINTKEVLVRLIDVGLTFQTKISSMKALHPRLKALQAFASEINLEKSLDVTFGQILKINRFTVDADGKINVTLRPEVKTVQSTHQAIKIETLSLPTGVPLELFCLDYGNIDKGYISVCQHDAEKIESINQLSDKIKAYLQPFGKAGSYSPNLDEICFAYHRSDRQWYRAECISVMKNDKFEVIFIDYGITSIVTSANLRKFARESTEFSQPSLMHFCHIKGIPREPTKELVGKISRFFEENSIFPVKSAQYSDGMVIIDCPKLMRTIA